MHAPGIGIYEFGPFRLDPVERILSGEGNAVALSPKAFDLLIALVSQAGRVVSKDELMREVWPDTFVEENNLTVNFRLCEKLWKNQFLIKPTPKRCRAGVTVL